MSVPITLQGDISAEEVRASAKRCMDAAQVRRLVAIAAILDGGSRSEAARISGMTVPIIRDWVLRFNEAGVDGLPLLSGAASVHIVCGSEVVGPAGRLSCRLAVMARHPRRSAGTLAEPSIEEVLQAAAGVLGASCIVMGGYGHLRMREFVFGGVTRAMLRGCPVPLLLSH